MSVRVTGVLRGKMRRYPAHVAGSGACHGRWQMAGTIAGCGHPRPGRSGDGRGHSVSCAADGGDDISLVPIEAALNRDWSPKRSRFRELELKAATTPGRLFFFRTVYLDGTDQPSRFEAGVQDDEEPVKSNIRTPSRTMLVNSRERRAWPVAISQRYGSRRGRGRKRDFLTARYEGRHREGSQPSRS